MPPGRYYIRLDVDLPDRKGHYPDGAMAAYIAVLCQAANQPIRGMFRNETVLRGYLGRRAKWIPYLLDQEDLVRLADGRLYVQGWNEWQEGDITAAERMRRMRARRRGNGANDTAPVTAGVTGGVTEDVAFVRSGTHYRDIDSKERTVTPPPPVQTFMGWKPPPAEPEEVRRERMAEAIRKTVPAMRPRLVATYERHFGPWTETETAPEPGGTGKPSGPDAGEES
jgi:hypothetical protein